MKREEFLECLGEDFTFRVRSVVKQVALANSLLVRLDRVELQHIVDDYIGNHIIRGLFRFATLEEEVFDYPDNFLTRLGQWWHAFKAKKFPRRLYKRFPNVTKRVWATHKFPELNMPNELVGREFIHFRVVNEDKLAKVDKERKNE